MRHLNQSLQGLEAGNKLNPSIPSEGTFSLLSPWRCLAMPEEHQEVYLEGHRIILGQGRYLAIDK